MENAGKRLREFRERKGLSLRELGERIGVAYSYISVIENGKRTPNIEVLSKAAKVLDVDLADFFEHKQTVENDGEKWQVLGRSLEKEGITIDEVKQWVEIAKTIREQSKNDK